MSKWILTIITAPETNLFLFAFLLNFVYEVWQSPYFEFHNMPLLADKIGYITHCTVGDGVITIFSFWIVSALCGSRYWLLNSTWKLTLLFTALGWIYTFISEIYRVQIAKLYGVSVLVIPGVGTSWLPLLQWIILPPLVLYVTKRHLLGYGRKD
jgi:hypothetical protein